jgi:predicted aldo/keto reductase-like oxidoreductase
MQNFQPLSSEEYAVIEKVQKLLAESDRVACTDCRYCLKGCPAGVKISSIFRALNTYKVYNDLNGAKGSYRFSTSEGGKADACIACGQCEDACPQKLPIIELLKQAHEILA